MNRVLSIAALIVALLCAPLAASEQAIERGPVTNLPLPRFVSLKASEGNVRRGPSLSHRIDWVFKHRNMPLQIVAEHGHWRRVVDRDGAGGWVHYTLLSGSRFGLVEDDLTPIYKAADTNAQIAAYAEMGVVARLGKCDQYWCRVTVSGSKGWMPREKLWGLMPGETRD